MIDIPLEKEGIIVARFLLIQAGIRPTQCDCLPGDECHCQYEIGKFSIAVDGIVIFDKGQPRFLKAVEAVKTS